LRRLRHFDGRLDQDRLHFVADVVGSVSSTISPGSDGGMSRKKRFIDTLDVKFYFWSAVIFWLLVSVIVYKNT
jgi:hypothetical protein